VGLYCYIFEMCTGFFHKWPVLQRVYRMCVLSDKEIGKERPAVGVREGLTWVVSKYISANDDNARDAKDEDAIEEARNKAGSIYKKDTTLAPSVAEIMFNGRALLTVFAIGVGLLVAFTEIRIQGTQMVRTNGWTC
jgi:hypothetical protein